MSAADRCGNYADFAKYRSPRRPLGRRPRRALRAWRGARPQAAELVSSARRRRGPMPGTSSSSDRRSRIVRALRWNVTAKRCASSRMRWSSSSAGSCLGERDRLRPVAREEQLLLLRDADRHQVAEPDRLERVVGRRQLPLAAVDQDQIRETARRLRAPCDSGAAPPRASPRSRPGTWALRS